MKKLLLVLIFVLFLFPCKVFALDLLENGDTGILIEANSGKILFEKEKDKRVSVASMTKMVAQIIIFEELEKGSISLEDIVTVSHNASSMGGSQIYLETGEKISVLDLIKGISVASGNDATVAMAEYISGTEEKFVERMNSTVKKMGLKNTHFKNCTGLDEEDHYSSSYDMALIARELVLKHPDILKYSSIYEDYLRQNTENKFWLVNTNKLIHFYDGADGLKTGHTDNAGYCLAATAKRGDLRLIGIVLGEKDSKVRNQEMMELLDYGFNTIKMNCLMQKDSVVDTKNIDLAFPNTISIVLKDNLCVVEEKEDTSNYQFQVELNHLDFPIRKGDVIGKINVLENHSVVSTQSLTVLEDITRIKLFEFVKKTFVNFIYGIF
ncbi:MAG: D-alanyl-D-alanine carboxypeptidase [Bacilli bacterium]|nr:D-alanyl-D-alanine carboxypeptidase [Bacilli bacterium]